MAAAEHRIGRLVIEIAASDGEALDHACETMRSRFDAIVVPALQAALDRIDRPGAVIRLGQVEINVGTLNWSALTADDLAQRIGDGLAAHLRRPASGAADAAPALGDAAELAGFLETGELPWSEPGRALATLTAALMALDTDGMVRLAARLRTVLIRRRAAERLVRQLPAAFVRRLIRGLLPEAVAAQLAAAFGPDGAGEGSSTTPVPDRLVAPLVDALQSVARDADAADLGSVVALLAALDARGAPVAAASPVPQAGPEPQAGSERPRPKEPAPEEDSESADAKPRPIHAAGAVLLHPFLADFFDQVGLLAAPGRFHGPSARARAVLLLHHLATGADEAPEPETVLFKLLCGLPLQEPVPRRIALTEAERAEGDALLTSVIGHWKSLGNTSPAGLRDGFLTRPGHLERRAGLWRLTLERRGIDVLLDRLPWTLSRVKTPFMRELLTVDWW